MQVTTPVILLVEDEALLVDVIEDALKEAGFQVRAVLHGRDAMMAVEDGEFHAIVTDIKLPSDGPNGWDIGHRARELSPDVAIVYMSGDSAIEWKANGVPNSVMLQKPFASAQLVTAISMLLNDVIS